VKLSIVIPTRSRDDLLARCLGALAPQIERDDMEVIVTDDGSDGSTRQMIEARFPFTRWTQGPRRGPAANRNHGAAAATGALIVFLDDDVEPAPHLVSSYLCAVTPDIDIYEGRTTCLAGIHSPLEIAPINETGGLLWSCNMMVRRSFWESFGGFDEDFAYPHLEDVAIRERIRQAGRRTLFVRDAVVDHPPRRLPPAFSLARYHESYFVYRYKYTRQPAQRRGFLTDLFRHRLWTVLQYPPSLDSARAVQQMCMEALYVLRHWKEWDRKWRARAQSAAPQHGTATE